MGHLRALLILVLAVATLAECKAIKPKIKRDLRSSRLTKPWRQDTGVGFISDVGTAGGNFLAKPRSASCTQEGFFPQPGNCTSFIRCVDFSGTGRYFSVYRFTCPFGTVFDDDLDVCNHPWAVKNPPECAGGTPNLPGSVVTVSSSSVTSSQSSLDITDPPTTLTTLSSTVTEPQSNITTLSSTITEPPTTTTTVSSTITEPSTTITTLSSTITETTPTQITVTETATPTITTTGVTNQSFIFDSD
ncbi:hypothetical protein SK128_007708 [Halocaridina rubra]|uniref:Chitin-binding type-2 domain-containing protein n=1 Tax=Halocaridina rubra TaxID=373956 RepID=A0AAN8WLK4_HALRR